MKKITLTISGLSLLLALTSQSPADLLNWTNQAGGSWEAAGNWNPNTTPNATNRLTITSGSYTVLINDATANNDPGGAASWMAATGGAAAQPGLTLGAAGMSPTLLVDFTNTLKSLVLSHPVASGSALSMLGDSKLIISNGSVSVSGASLGGVAIGNAAGANATLGLYSATASFLTPTTLSVGSAPGGTGTLDVAAGTLSAGDVVVGGGTLASGTGVGTWRARGNSTNSAANVIVGNFTNSVGYLYVEDNAMVTFDNLRFGGTPANTGSSTGFVYVTGGSLSVTGTAVNVFGTRLAAYSFLSVSNNGTVDFRGDINVANNNRTFGEIHVLGGKLTSGGILTLGSTTIGSSTGLATVAGSGILELQTNLVLGGASKLGILTNASGGTVQFTGLNNPTVTVGAGSSFVTTNAVIEFKNASAFVTNVFGKITFQGANTLSLLNSTNANLGAYTFASGQNYSTLRLAGTNSLWQSTTLTIGSGGSLIGNGRINSANATNSGTIAPGSSPGTLSFSNNLTLLSSSILDMELDGTNAGTYDRILVDGNFLWDGTLNVSLLSYTPVAGDTFDLFDFGSMSGSFTATNLPSLSGGLAWDFAQFDTQGILAVTAVIPEPNSLVTMAVAGLGWAVLRRRRSS